MSKSTTSTADVVQFRRNIDQLLRKRIRETIQVVLEEELTSALGSERYERTEARQGYRNGHDKRLVTTPMGAQEFDVPRGRIMDRDGATREFQGQVLPRYQRRTREVDEAILGIYLAGANSRRIRKALLPLLGAEHLSKSSISRVVNRLKQLYAEWSSRPLEQERYVLLFLDGFYLKVRMARRVISVPVLAALGVMEDGSKRLVALRLATSESGAAWSAFVTDLERRGLGCPELVVSDGHAGLKKAMKLWPDTEVQRCSQHKWQNMADRCPVHARKEMKRDYDAIIYAADGMAARKAYKAFVDKWSSLCADAVRSLEEAGEQLLTFYAYPKGLWRALRTTNSLENLNREFRRRTKTQGSFSTEEAALTLLFGLVAFGQIRLRRINGHKHLGAIASKNKEVAA